MGWFRRNEHDEEQLSAYLDGELTARQAENVERHLAACATCSALLEELRETQALLSALPAQAPRRSFVLGAEYARAPVQEAERPPKRWNLALAPAAALSVLVALVVVDMGNFSSSSSDESADMFSAATSRQVAEDDVEASGSAGSIGGSEGANASGEATDATAGQPAQDAPEPAQPGAGAAATGPEPTLEGPPAALSAEALPTPADADGSTQAQGEAAEESLPEPIALEGSEPAEGDGISTLRILQVLAGAAFLASGFYVFVWPRLSRGGS